MHIADGSISQTACVVTSGLAAVTLVWAVRKARTSSSTDQLKLAPFVAATVFGGQMVNFALGSGLSGHLVGSALAAIILGPALAMIVMAAVIAAQCAILGDGGTAALGANVLSMSVVSVLVADLVWNRLRKHYPTWAAAGITSWASVVAGSIACTAVIADGGIAVKMLTNHSIIGIAEAAISIVALLGWLASASLRKRIALLSATALGLLVLSPMSSTLPDGLEAALTHSVSPVYSLVGLLLGLPVLFALGRGMKELARGRALARVRR